MDIGACVWKNADKKDDKGGKGVAFKLGSINQSINENLTSGSSPEGDVRDVSNSIYNYRQHPTTRTLLQMHKQKEKCEVQNSASPLSKARRSVTTDLRWEEMSF